MNQTYLVTGGAGFIGSHLCEALLAQGDKVVIVDDLSSGKTANLAGCAKDVQLIQGDVRDLAALAPQIPHVDGVIHLAALISGYDSLSAPDAYDDINIRGTLRLIEFVAQRGIKRIVFASSSTVYGNGSEGNLTEANPPAPLTVYALTKLVGEHLLDLYGRMHGFSHCSLRLFNVYGPRQAIDHPYANVTCKFSHAAVFGLPVKLYGDGGQSRDFVYVDDVVRAFLAVLPASAQPIYNVGTGQDRSIREMIASLEQVTGRPMQVESAPAWPNDIRHIRAATDRLADEFGFRPQVGLAEGLAATVEFFRSAGPGDPV